jgi:outer membrane protein OmpA-like peptidoglycan-associated protein|tara:strand:+ start:437 stop:1165 length:729 start_codon:yes stop_codon:yes gene_type:complete
MKKNLGRLVVIMCFFLTVNEINSQEIPLGKCLFTTHLSNYDSIPQTNAKMIIWNSKDSLLFNKEVISDIEGKGSFVLDQGNEYSIKVFKSDTSMVFKNIFLEKLDYPYSVDYNMYIKIYKQYSQILDLDVNFATNSSIIPSESKLVLDQLYNRLEKNSETKIELASHTDSDGDNKSNMLLSQRRSESVKTYLVNKGINIERIEAQGYGEKQPKASNETKIGKATNRRTEVRISVFKTYEEVK